MSEPIYLLLGIHHHQPVGNFDGVFSMAFEKCYRPFLDVLERHPSIKVSLHHSGPLLDWAIEHDCNYFERISALVRRGQVEILSGGYYEPILPIWKTTDAMGQIEMMQSFWEEKTGRRPAGMWLAERVWEPSLASLIAAAGLEFTILDDEHFRHAGLTDETLFGYYRTERAGKTISIFPSDKLMRYLIPFKMPQDVVGHLLHLQERHPGKAITYGDDGEKFGMWPGTHDWVVKQGWLDKFFAGLEENKKRIVTLTFSEFMRMRPASAAVYLPTASYSEMLEWAMPAQAILNFERTKKAIENAGLWNQAAPFFRGGFWDNFLTKYPESNLIHKRVLFTSDRIDKAEKNGPMLYDARKALYRAQCNCAYWHGLFGGIYLNYLRHALYSNLIEADVAVDNALFGGKSFIHEEVLDIDKDGHYEVVLSNETVSCIVKPSQGGAMVALDFKPRRFNLLNTMARRFEAYYELKEGAAEVQGDAIPSIHDLGKDIGELRKTLVYDHMPKYAFVERVFGDDLDVERLYKGNVSCLADFGPVNFRLVGHSKDAACASAKVAAKLETGDLSSVEMEKEYVLRKGGEMTVALNFRFTGKAPPPWIVEEINFTLLAGHDLGRFYEWKGVKPGEVLMDSRRVVEGISEIGVVDRAFGFRMRISSNQSHVVIAPVETISQSEKGFDRTYQGSTIWLVFKPAWTKNGECKFSVGISIEKL